jgi:diacylglycerol kinase
MYGQRIHSIFFAWKGLRKALDLEVMCPNNLGLIVVTVILLVFFMFEEKPCVGCFGICMLNDFVLMLLH